jgi:hypothetical protein
MPSSTIGALIGYSALLGRVEGLSGPPTLPVSLCTTSSIQGLLLVKPLYIAPFPTLEALLWFQNSLVRFTIQYLGVPNHPLIIGPLGLLLTPEGN